MAAAINLVSSQTGVTASADATSGALTLTAADGRDISIGLNGTATEGLLSGAQTTAADLAKSDFLAKTGLVSGTQGTAGIAGNPAVAAVNTLTYSAGAVANDTATINGVIFTFTQNAAPSIAVVDATHVTINRDMTGTLLMLPHRHRLCRLQ